MHFNQTSLHLHQCESLHRGLLSEAADPFNAHLPRIPLCWSTQPRSLQWKRHETFSFLCYLSRTVPCLCGPLLAVCLLESPAAQRQSPQKRTCPHQNPHVSESWLNMQPAIQQIVCKRVYCKTYSEVQREKVCADSALFGLIPTLDSGMRLHWAVIVMRFSVLGAVYTEIRKTPRHANQL